MCPVGKFQNWFYIHYGRYYSRLYLYYVVVVVIVVEGGVLSRPMVVAKLKIRIACPVELMLCFPTSLPTPPIPIYVTLNTIAAPFYGAPNACWF